MPLTVVSHPLVDHRVAALRDPATPPVVFRQVTRDLATFLVYEATRDLKTEPSEIVTALGVPAPVRRLVDPGPLVVPILRAGLGLLDGVLAVLPAAEVGLVGLGRNESTFRAEIYCERLPDDLTGRDALIIDPMLATGGSMTTTAGMLFARNVSRVIALCLIAAPEGVERVHKAHPEIEIVTAVLDDRLDDRAYIVPGLGDAGDRLFGMTAP
jgi:uracil phosphoribosyltransferase